ncbi:hypothetical protein Ahy_B04g070820 isoform B [Arachis hypogaea]|uniref:Aminotransferase-like plant mobile domain-containing protein n=1 Tax=Arachis hypogaea TaxID=3818 RepID=A0A444ZJR0_ARAHY|nr:hypothetical protein Ahy_B04g070820 isoform B [Arachis hypogaea]
MASRDAYFHMLFGECTIMLQDVAYQLGLRSTVSMSIFSELLQGTNDETVRRYVRTHIIMLLSTQLFNDKSGTRLHIRRLPYVARDMGRYSWGSATLSWLYRCMCHVANRNIVKLASPLQVGPIDTNQWLAIMEGLDTR